MKGSRLEGLVGRDERKWLQWHSPLLKSFEPLGSQICSLVVEVSEKGHGVLHVTLEEYLIAMPF
jgi:hypothetical protein